MSDFFDTNDLIDNFYDLEPTALDIPAQAKPAKKSYPVLPRCPRKDSITVAQFQFFDNGENCGRGKSQHVIKLEIYHRGWSVKLHQPDWYRTIQLISPKKVLKWADDKLRAGEITASQHAVYVAAKEACDLFMAEGGAPEWAKIGHISGGGRANTYHVGQFIIVLKRETGELIASVMIDGEELPCEKFVKDRRERKAGARTHYGFYDPARILLKQREEQRELERRRRGQ